MNGNLLDTNVTFLIKSFIFIECHVAIEKCKFLLSFVAFDNHIIL